MTVSFWSKYSTIQAYSYDKSVHSLLWNYVIRIDRFVKADGQMRLVEIHK